MDQASYEPGPYLVVDIGYRTTDFIIVTKHRDGGLDFDPMAAGSLNIGMYTADAGLAESLSAQHRTAFTAAQMAGQTEVIVRGRRIGITSERASQEIRVARQIVKELLAKLDSQMDQVLGLVAVGGGSDVLLRAIPTVIQTPEPQWANARGYLSSLLVADIAGSGRISGLR